MVKEIFTDSAIREPSLERLTRADQNQDNPSFTYTPLLKISMDVTATDVIYE
jgi:hypothetical protein